MPSQYRPQIFGWSRGLGKNISFTPKAGKSVNYVDQVYCEVIREKLTNRIWYGVLGFISLFLLLILIIYGMYSFHEIIYYPIKASLMMLRF